MSISDKLYRRIVEAVPEGVWVCDPQGRTIFSNSKMAEILGIDFELMPKTSCFECLFPEDFEDANRRFSTALAGGDMPAFDFRLRRGDGSEVWVSISCMIFLDDAGAPAGLLGLFSDITQRRKTEAALRESEARFLKMADMAPVMLWVTDPDKRVTFVNKA